MKTPNINTTRVALPQIYAYTTPEISRHNGWVKIGYTEQNDVRDRIKQQCHTADIAWKLEWNGNAVYESSNETFLDKAFHAYLGKLGYEQQPDTEWFRIGVDDSHHRFYDFRSNHGVVQGKPTQHYQLRDSQEQAVSQTMESFTNRPQTKNTSSNAIGHWAMELPTAMPTTKIISRTWKRQVSTLPILIRG